jgi:type II secretory pathway component PulJ
MKSLAQRPGTRAGFTLLESMVSLVVFTAIGGALALATRAGQQTERSVTDESNSSRSLREVTSALTDELRSSSDTQITVTALADGNDSLRFLVPIQNGTTLGWGVYDPSLGSDEASENRVGWSLRYTVESVVSGSQTTRRLLRQVLDQAQTVQRQRVVLDRLHSGTDNPPGFTVRKQGAMWEITLSAEPRSAVGKGIQEVFHVQARNQ